MSHALRAAVAAGSLLTVPACVTTDAPGTTQTRTDSGRGDSVPAADDSTGVTGRQVSGLGSPSLGGTATLLAWAQSQTGTGGVPRGAQNFVFEQPDSRLRLVLNMLDRGFSGGASGVGGTKAAAETVGEVWAPQTTAFWLATPAAVPAELLGLDHTRVTLGGPVGEGVGELIAGQAAEIRNTPEPGTLALTGAGVCVLGVVRRLRRA